MPKRNLEDFQGINTLGDLDKLAEKEKQEEEQQEHINKKTKLTYQAITKQLSEFGLNENKEEDGNDNSSSEKFIIDTDFEEYKEKMLQNQKQMSDADICKIYFLEMEECKHLEFIIINKPLPEDGKYADSIALRISEIIDEKKIRPKIYFSNHFKDKDKEKDDWKETLNDWSRSLNSEAPLIDDKSFFEEKVRHEESNDNNSKLELKQEEWKNIKNSNSYVTNKAAIVKSSTSAQSTQDTHQSSASEDDQSEEEKNSSDFEEIKPK